jgi:hypothetical protein
MTAQADAPYAERIVHPAARHVIRRELRWRGLVSWATAGLALALFVLTVVLFAGAVSSADSQVAQLSRTAAGYRQQLAADNAAIKTLQGQVSALQAKTAPVTADTTRCATGLSGPVGGVTYYFWCSSAQAPKTKGS